MVRTTGPRVLPAAPRASEVCSGCRPWQVGLILDDDGGVAQSHVAGRALVQGHMDDPVDLLRSRHAAKSGRVPLGSSGLVGFAGFGFLAAERVGLTMRLASGFVQPLAEFAVL